RAGSGRLGAIARTVSRFFSRPKTGAAHRLRVPAGGRGIRGDDQRSFGSARGSAVGNGGRGFALSRIVAARPAAQPGNRAFARGSPLVDRDMDRTHARALSRGFLAGLVPVPGRRSPHSVVETSRAAGLPRPEYPAFADDRS